MDLDSFLVSLYVLVDDWGKLDRAWRPPKPGRPALLSDPEVITLAILAQWPASEARGTSGVSLLRTCAPTSEPVFAEPAQPAHPSPGAADAPLAAELRPRARRAFGRLSRDGHDPGAGHREGEGQRS